MGALVAGDDGEGGVSVRSDGRELLEGGGTEELELSGKLEEVSEIGSIITSEEGGGEASEEGRRESSDEGWVESDGGLGE